MAAIPVSFTGVMWYPDLSVGGGPMPGGPPLGIWGGGNVPVPTPPIYYPPAPVDPGYGHPIAPPGFWPGTPPPRPQPQPPGIWGGGNVPMPTPPIYYPPSPPLGIWGPTDPRPSHPIVLPPVEPGGPPVQIWGPTDPRPTHPIVLPPQLPNPPEGAKPPPPEGGWGYHPDFGWGYFPPADVAQPKKK
jgi:hypothetical protein